MSAALDPEERRRRRAERRADRLTLLASGPPSPCISVCQIDNKTGYCLGCRRTLDEITNWGSMTDEQQAAVLAQLPGRRPAPSSDVAEVPAAPLA